MRTKEELPGCNGGISYRREVETADLEEPEGTPMALQ